MTARGRPAYVPTDKDRRVVEMMAGWAIPEARIATVLTIDPKTLHKHFATELDVGHAKLEAQLAQNLLRIAQGHNRQSLIATIFALKSRFGWIEQQPPAREQPLGKKDARMEAAQRAVSGNFKFAPTGVEEHQRHLARRLASDSVWRECGLVPTDFGSLSLAPAVRLKAGPSSFAFFYKKLQLATLQTDQRQSGSGCRCE